MYYRGAAAALVVYDITDGVRERPCRSIGHWLIVCRLVLAQDSFNGAKTWIEVMIIILMIVALSSTYSCPYTRLGAAATRQRRHCHRPGRQQAGYGIK